MSRFPDHPAWDFVTGLYAAPGVASACLTLQDRHDLDVTLMLFCLWRGTIPQERMAALVAAAREWRAATVLPIRAARRWLKERPEQDGLYRGVLATEIDCEHGELLMLAALAGAPQAQPAAEDRAVNLAAFFNAWGVQPDEQDIAALLAAAEGFRV